MQPMHEWGHAWRDELDPMVVVSPHFDDAVMGCGQLLAVHPGSVVITVLGGRPDAYPEHVTTWDAYGGFLDGDDVVAARQKEDEAALAVLRARPVWLDFSDHQYVPKEHRYRPEQVAGPLEDAILAAAPASVFIPFGLANPDHALTHDAARLVIERHPELRWFAYEEGGYKHIPGMQSWRVSALFHSGLWPTPAVVPIDHGVERKREAMSCYATQLPALEGEWGYSAQVEARVPEQFWRLAPPPPGWERLAER